VRQRPAKPCTRVRFPSPPLFLDRARLAQRESASLTRKRSLVQSQYRAPQFVQMRPGFYRAFIVSAQQTRNKAGGLHQAPEDSQMTQTTSTPDMPPPADATFIGDWDACGAGTPYRFIIFAERTVTDHPARVSLHASQWANGSLAGSGEEAPGIAILDASIQPLNSDQARELASALAGRRRRARHSSTCARDRIALVHI
jgi:hypothetical protein